MENAYRFDIGIGDAMEGYTKISDSTGYDKDLGYGFTNTDLVTARDRCEPGMLKRDFVIPFNSEFRVDLPDGTYQISLVIGDAFAAAHTTVKSSSLRLMLRDVKTSAGQFVKESFALPVRDGRMSLLFSGMAPRMNALEITPVPNTLTLFLAGDSTVTDQSADGYPYAGWGQMLPHLFKHDIAVSNHAYSGRSSKSFIEEGRLDAIWSEMKPHDMLLIQFGHNDQKQDEERRTEPFTTYKEYLKVYIEGARERDALPILVTPVHRRYFDNEGGLKDTHGDYITAMKELAAEENVHLVDLAAKSKQRFEELGPEGTKSVFMWSAPGEYLNFPNGVQDNTHFQERGAIRIAELVVEGLKELQIHPLAMYFKDN